MKMFFTITAAIVAAVFILSVANWIVLFVAICVAALSYYPSQAEMLRGK